jgi:hypothetical protein
VQHHNRLSSKQWMVIVKFSRFNKIQKKNFSLIQNQDHARNLANFKKALGFMVSPENSQNSKVKSSSLLMPPSKADIKSVRSPRHFKQPIESTSPGMRKKLKIPLE